MKKRITLGLLMAVLCTVSAMAADVTIRFKAPAGWENVFVYTWGPEVTAGWPGNEVTATKDSDGFYAFVVDDSSLANGIHAMFNNNAGEKTDIYHTGGDACYETTTSETVTDGILWGTVKVLCSGGVTPPTGNTTVRFKAPAGWTRVLVYTYNPTITAGYWDTELTKGSDGFYAFNFDMPAQNSIQVMFHNGKAEAEEKVDIYVTASGCFETTGTLSGGYWEPLEIACPTTSIDNEEASFIGFYPNPTSDFIYFPEDNKVERVMIINAVGQQMQVLNQVTNKVDFSAYPAGIYYMMVFTTSGQQTVKVIKI